MVFKQPVAGSIMTSQAIIMSHKDIALINFFFNYAILWKKFHRQVSLSMLASHVFFVPIFTVTTSGYFLTSFISSLLLELNSS